MISFKKLIFMILISVIAIGAFTGCSAKKKVESQLDVKIDFGYEGTIKVASKNPLVATIKNNGPAFSGELQIEVEDNMNGKMLMAMPFEMAENSQKEIQLQVPVFIIQKKFVVRVASDHNTLYEKTISAKKVLSPNQHVMAVVTDTPDAYRFLENTKTTLMQQAAYMEKAVAADVYQAVETEELEVIFLDSFSALNSEEKLSYFDYIYLGHNQSLSISEEEERVIGDWIEAGNCFVI
ncbi:MAG: hypothetical protein H7X94_12610, partial [Vallitaleaceae bacterium]|nr:hypothetical protein [Vallitaleaceae bacterium]